MPRRALVIGYGNTLRGDDAFGLVVCHHLEQRLADPRVTILARPLLTPELAHDLARADLAVFIDASSEGEAGRIVGREVVSEAQAAASMTHHLTPGRLLALADLLYQTSPSAYLITCGSQSFELGEDTLSPAVQTAVPVVVEQVCGLIQRQLDIQLAIR